MLPLARLQRLHQLQRNRRRQLPTPRIFRDRTKVLKWTDAIIKKHLHMWRDTLLILIQRCDRLQPNTKRNCSLPVALQVAVTVKWCCSHNYYYDVSEMFGIHEASVGRCIRSVTKLLSENIDDVLHFPTSQAEIREAHSEFYALRNIQPH